MGDAFEESGNKGIERCMQMLKRLHYKKRGRENGSQEGKKKMTKENQFRVLRAPGGQVVPGQTQTELRPEEHGKQ